MVLSMFVALAGCGDSNYQAQPIAVTFSTGFPPPTALETNATTGIAVVVSNDPKNAGAKFSCVPAQHCGTFSPNPITSNVPTTYQAPATVPGSGSVTITATSVTDSTKSASATVTINEP